MGGAGEELLKGGAGNDVIDAGESQLGDIADGGSGVDFIHNGNATGVAASFTGETGDDFIQGGKNSDLLLEGGEGSDWIEGGAGVDLLVGDLGPFGGALGPESIFGGNDVINGGADNDLVNGNGGDDIINMGDGIDISAGGAGFDFVNYEGVKRFDNGLTTRPSAYIELSGVNPNPINSPQDLYAGIEGASGGPGNDKIFGTMGADFSVAGVTGTAGATFIKLPGAVTTVIAGMQVTGTGIGANALTVAPGAVVTINGVTTTTIDLTVPNSGAVNGTVAFNTFALTTPGSITGLTDIVRGTPGWTKYSNVTPTATKWSGGSILMGGAGNNTFTLSTGSNVVHGSAQLHTCLYVTHNGSEFNTGSDVACGAGRGYSSMSLIAGYMDTGVLQPGDVRTVKELVGTNVNVTGSMSNGTSITYTAANSYLVGDRVNVTGMTSNAAFNVLGATVTAATPTSFTVAVVAPVAALAAETGRSGYYNVLVVPAASTATTIARIAGVLPSGAMSGYTLTTATNVDYVYDIAAITFSNAVTVQLAPWVSTLTTLASSIGTFTPAFNSGVTNYQISVPANATTTTVTPTASASGETITVNGVAVASGAASAAITLSTTAATVVTVVATSADLTSTTTYTLTYLRAGLTPTLSTRLLNSQGISSSVTNYNAAYTYTITSSAGAVRLGTPTGTVLPFSVVGLFGGQTANINVTVQRAGYATTSVTVAATALNSVALTPLFDNPVATQTGFTVNVTNYLNTYTFACSASTGYTCTMGAANGAVLPITVVGAAAAGQSPVLTVTTTKSGSTSGSNTVSAFTIAALGLQSKSAPRLVAPSKRTATAHKVKTKKSAKVKTLKVKTVKLKK